MNILVQTDPDAPPSARYYAIDVDTFDGAPDAGKSGTVGSGATPMAAVADWLVAMGYELT